MYGNSFYHVFENIKVSSRKESTWAVSAIPFPVSALLADGTPAIGMTESSAPCPADGLGR